VAGLIVGLLLIAIGSSSNHTREGDNQVAEAFLKELQGKHSDRIRAKSAKASGIPIGVQYRYPAELVPNQSWKDRRDSEVIYQGSDSTYDLRIDKEPNPHMIIVGESGSGKSTTMGTLLIRSKNKFNIPFLVVDWSGTYEDIAEGVKVWRVPEDLRVNPFKLLGLPPSRRSGIAAELLQFSLDLTDLQAQRVRDLLHGFYANGREPTISDITDEISRSTTNRQHLYFLVNKLRPMAEVFGDEPKDFWSNYDKRCNIIELEGLTDMEKSLVTNSILQRIVESFKVQPKTRLYIALDDAYQVIKSYEGKESPITKIVREGRKYGFGLIIATQLLQDMPDSIIGNTSVKFIHSYHESYGMDRIHKTLALSDVQKRILHLLPTGHCLLFDQYAMKDGSGYPSYVEVERVNEKEKESLTK
jgi:hypothetical protein